PLSAQAWISSASMGREASLMSISPLQNSSNPSPVPGPSTFTATSGACSAKDSATAVEMGSTVDEPETRTSPETSPDPPSSDVAAEVSVAAVSPPSSSLLQLAAASPSTATMANSHTRWRFLVNTCPPSGVMDHLDGGRRRRPYGGRV